jgi:hypothetical protein
MIMKEMLYIPIKLKPELARASITTHTHLWTCSPKAKVIPNVVIALKIEASDTTNRKVF